MTLPVRRRCALTLGQLRRECDPEAIIAGSEKGVIGQEEAMESLDLGLRMNQTDYAETHYNICVVGRHNTGRKAKTLIYLREFASKVDFKPDDVVCIYNHDNPRKPLVTTVTNGMAERFKRAVKGLGIMAMEKMATETEQTKQNEAQKFGARHNSLVGAATVELKKLGFLLTESGPGSLAVAYLNPDGTVLQSSEYEELSDEEKAEWDKRKEESDKIVKQLIDDLNTIGKEAGKMIAKLRETNISKITKHGGAILRTFGKTPALLRFFTNLTSRLADIATIGLPEGEEGLAMRSAIKKMTTVNILVDNAGVEHPPVIYSDEPQYSRVFGRISGEPGDKEGTIRVDHTMVEAGDLLQANGGYLVLDMNQLIKSGGAISFYKLLQVVRTGQLSIESKASFVDVGMLVEFRVEDVPVNVRVVVICDWMLARVLSYVEPDFDNLFRITAEFAPDMSVGEATSAYGTFVKIYSDKGEILPSSKAAVAKLVEYGSWLVENRFKATTEFGLIKDVIAEASHWAKHEGSEQIGAQHVQQAIDERYRRKTLLARRYQEHWEDGHILLSLDGERVGVVNGLVVMLAGGGSEFAFGLPRRVTARAFAGKDKVVLVQRETDNSGPSSNAAVETIAGWLAGQYGRNKPLSLTVKLSFEQIYSGVDGDSATVAETIACLSAISELPVDQRLVVTGSMNQLGEVQPIGGVNHKIEGHVGLLNRKAVLTFGHGAVIPVQNMDGLMLSDEVLKAHAEGKYRIYAVSHIDEAIELFFGLPAEVVHKVVKKKLAEIGKKKPWFLVQWLGAFAKLFTKEIVVPPADFGPPEPERLRLLPAPPKRDEAPVTGRDDELVTVDIDWDDTDNEE